MGIVAESARALGFEPDVLLPRAHDRMVHSDIAAHLLVVVREGLNNVARHASATAATVEIELGDEFVARVIDNGVGVSQDQISGGYGLQNMRDRAAVVGGEFTVGARHEGGTLLEWRVSSD